MPDGPEPGLAEAVLGGARTLTRPQVIAAAGIDPEEGERLWRALGFPEPADDDVLFTDRDVEAVRVMQQLGDAGLLPPRVREAVARAVAQDMSRLAEWQVGMLRTVLAGPAGERSPADLAAALVPELGRLQDYVWRRHLAAALERAAPGAADSDTRPLAVGFADMVGFTRATRRRSAAELDDLLERFSARTAGVIAEGRGRIVKTVGDEVLFVADDAATAAGIALALDEQVAADDLLPPLRIGLAAGEVLARFGDVFGEPVNIAARLTAQARPGTVLVDREVAAALDGDERFRVRRLRSRSVRGYRHLQLHALSRA
ncbi:adenylate/guanylate cyclase [Pseudonocardia dioxanivorans CB1190]|uniref:Adenylate/guanylate cyclase n=1 Tax=Pseudonocardia dioxanivorans (strain ATCC 55486 / DSM 44775 / JCM 13855 / CB1190) TaxID=675635 RepID=F4CYE1_PSEUX|nr:adenylate/guanylate cyclase domain-containing protein [Pseudonocardia dioxanivorans]AEA25581.1 adenylate/guanylate cyclase [Pseudonocardia dioxanivorans CB1190]GJF04908.1 adenylate/guanylate cyclase domain-containing protein [Pseudonocardia sp. D17]